MGHHGWKGLSEEYANMPATEAFANNWINVLWTRLEEFLTENRWKILNWLPIEGQKSILGPQTPIVVHCDLKMLLMLK